MSLGYVRCPCMCRLAHRRQAEHRGGARSQEHARVADLIHEMENSMKKKLMAVSSIGVATILSFVGAQPASANTWDQFCNDHVYDDTYYESAPNRQMWCRVQGGPARIAGYTGPVDGYMGVNSWKGFQNHLRAYGYTGPIDGVPGTNTYKAMQRMAADINYTGPIDGVMGPNSWRTFNEAVKIQFFGL